MGSVTQGHCTQPFPCCTGINYLVARRTYPNQFYDWLKKFFENGHLAFANGRKSKAVEEAKDQKIQHLEAKLVRKNEVLAELMEEHTLLKKELGES